MKKLPWILVILLAVACMVVWFRPQAVKETIRTETKVNTVVQIETLFISPPMAPLLVFRLTDTIRIGNTVVYREQAYYEDSLYRAWVSGYRPRLDSLMVFPKTVYQTVTNDIYHPVMVKPKPKRWGLGLQAGYGYPDGFYVGGGISYNLFQW
ncbi:DUF6808 domain-containing protein [Bacteroides cellulosilyticus]|uniref:DUF6808 domain-containing protein n=1 Tax=Bacteroides cellulosilyticus TaxID=246787 RepID=A0AAW8VHD4_9BACE|nr:hypothetical protein [Bacteroides cellulosilyticus]MDT4511858.1 hypothetical protein [Bacteroides cellulosilyticus]